MTPNTEAMEETQERMEQWLKSSLAPDAQLNQVGVIPLLKPQFVRCDLKNKSLTLSFEVEEWQMNPQNAMHGGITVTAIDTTFGVLCHYLAQKNMVTTVTLNVTYLKPILLQDKLYIHAHATSIGRKLISMTAEVYTERDHLLVTTATTTFMVLRHAFPENTPPSI